MRTAPLPGIQALLDSAHQAVTLAPFLGAATLAVTGVWAAVARGHIRRARAALLGAADPVDAWLRTRAGSASTA